MRNINFSLEEGEVLAVLGPNGAGKTTAIEILEGYLSRDGRASVGPGLAGPANGGTTFRQRIGIVLQEAGVEPYLTVTEVLRMHVGFYRAPRPLDELIALVGLEAKVDARVKTLSGGQQRRLDVALGLVGDPELLFLDEPTTGFDPSARRQAWEVVRNLSGLGKSVLLTTHYMDEAQALADRVVVISAGEIVAEGTPESFRAVATTPMPRSDSSCPQWSPSPICLWWSSRSTTAWPWLDRRAHRGPGPPHRLGRRPLR